MTSDPWLERWLPLIAQRAGSAPILELGCGHGDDTDTLTRAGHRVVALDVSVDAIDTARAKVPAGRFIRGDVREPLPVADGSIGVVLASLSLHYFPWPQTEEIVTRIRRALRASGVLLCRLNSTNDHNFGASGHKQIEPNYYRVKGKRKRFFDATDIARLFATGWCVVSNEELTTLKYGKPKVAWEVVAQCTPS